jgi:serine/threonine protein kinase
LETIGQGSEATVYRCEDQTATQYAVKVFYFSRFPPSQLPRRVENFKKEARILKYMSRRSRHFVYLTDYEYKPNENIGYMIMELGDGSLRQYLVGAPLSDEVLRDLEDAHIGN